MNEYRNEGKNSEQTPTQNPAQSPMQQIQTPQLPTKEQRDSGNKTFTGGSKDGDKK